MDKFTLTVAAVFSFGLSLQTVSAQDAVAPSGLTHTILAATAQTQFVSRSVYLNREERSFFVDAENLNYNLRDIVLRDSKGQEIKRMDVQNAPVDGIYEMSMETLATGSYEIELSSATRKEVFTINL